MEKNHPGSMNPRHPQDQKELRQIQTIRSDRSIDILEVIDEIRTSGRVTVLPELFLLLLRTLNNDIIQAVTKLLNDVKAADATGYFIAALKDPEYKPIRRILVSACWQNGLDFHDDILLFADLLVHDEYQVAIEAFTVIENNLGALDDPQISALNLALKKGKETAPDEKKSLINAMINVIRDY